MVRPGQPFPKLPYSFTINSSSGAFRLCLVWNGAGLPGLEELVVQCPKLTVAPESDRSNPHDWIQHAGLFLYQLGKKERLGPAQPVEFKSETDVNVRYLGTSTGMLFLH